MTASDRAAVEWPAWLPERLRSQAGPDGNPPPYVRYDDSVPVDEAGRWIDNNHWRNVRAVTHWHLIPPRKWAVSDAERFSTERMRAERVRSPAGVAPDPHQVVEQLDATLDTLIAQYGVTAEMLRSTGIETDEQRHLKSETTFRMAMFGMDVGRMLAICGGEIVHYGAHAMTDKDCAAPH